MYQFLVLKRRGLSAGSFQMRPRLKAPEAVAVECVARDEDIPKEHEIGLDVNSENGNRIWPFNICFKMKQAEVA